MPVVYNRYKFAPKEAVYIGRNSLWGNPFKIGPDGDRQDVCRQYEDMLKEHPELVQDIKAQLKGKDLVCFCAPLQCHGDTILRIANEEN